MKLTSNSRRQHFKVTFIFNHWSGILGAPPEIPHVNISNLSLLLGCLFWGIDFYVVLLV